MDRSVQNKSESVRPGESEVCRDHTVALGELRDALHALDTTSQVTNSKLETLERAVSRAVEAFEDISRRLYRDNGTKSIQTSVTEHRAAIERLEARFKALNRVLVWFATVLIGTIVIEIIKFFLPRLLK